MDALFGDLLPHDILARRGKATFTDAFLASDSRRFALAWDGVSGIDPEVVDGEILRAVWTAPNPHFGSAMLLQTAWLATHPAGCDHRHANVGGGARGPGPRRRPTEVRAPAMNEPNGDPSRELLRLRVGDLHWRSVEGEIVALDVANSEYLSINGSGAMLWAALGEGTTQVALVELLRERFDLSPDVAERDVAAFLHDVRAQGLLDGSPAEGA